MPLPDLETSLNYHFNDSNLLAVALSHRSYLNESPAKISNERLEFLGDAVLELVISEYLYHEKPNEPEGVLTAARSAIVRTESLAKIATRLNLGDHLKMSRGEEKSGGRTNVSLLADATEAVIGAIYLDGGYQPAHDFIYTHLLPLTQEALAGNLKDPKSLLQEQVQEKGYTSPTYDVVSESGPDHDKTFVVSVSVGTKKLATGEGKNKQTAQQAAAQKALSTLDQLAPRA